MGTLPRFLRALPLLIISPLLALAAALALAIGDLLWLVFGTRAAEPVSRRTDPPRSASVVIPNWNGPDLLEKYLPSVEAALSGNPGNEIIVVDNGSTDGSVEFLRTVHPGVRVLALPDNLGFGGGSNVGFRAASNSIVVLLNSDMRVAPDFLAPLLDGFADDRVFAVSCQIFFGDPEKLREESGLTQGWWKDGMLRVRHRIDDRVTGLFPCFYGGGGSCAFDRAKFLELGGFDRIFEPFYLEDTDLGYLAWKRGWQVLYQPKSRVWHEHRGTIGKRFSEEEIQAVLKKNFILFCWKNIHEWNRLGAHFFFAWSGALLSLIFGDEPGRSNFTGIWRAFLALPRALRSRWRSRRLASVSDSEAFFRPLAGYFRDRFAALPSEPARLSVLFVSPYPILPPVHGGGVFMYQTLCELVKHCDVHLVSLLDHASQLPVNEQLREICASAEFIVRIEGQPGAASIVPHAVREFESPDLEWVIHRQILIHAVDAVQLEYTPLGQYAGRFRRLASVLFEHDIYFQSIARSLGHIEGFIAKLTARFEYLRALRYELRMLPRCDRVQVCTRENGTFLASFLPELKSRLQEGLRAGINTADYNFHTDGREPFTMLFLGSFRHTPNQVALDWFAREVMPCILAREPRARLAVAGSDPPPAHHFAGYSDSIEILGFVDDVKALLGRYAVFVCPILSGSGVRVKLLEAFACGIPVVSTTLGAEGLAHTHGGTCLLADSPEAFADRVVYLFGNPGEAASMAARARAEVTANWDMAAITRKLAESYRDVIREKRTDSSPTHPERGTLRNTH